MTAPPSSATTLPPVVREQLEAPLPPPRGWARTLAPAFLGVVAWFPLLDALGGIAPEASTPSRWAVALLALGACYALVYLPLAYLGLRTRARLPVVAAEALGAAGGEWIAGVLYGLFAALWGSVAIWYSVRLTLDGLAAWGLLDRAAIDATTGSPPFLLQSPLVLVALGWWTFIIVSANGLNLMGVVTALMRVYSPFAGLLAAFAALWVRSRSGVGDGLRPGSAWASGPAEFQYIFGAFAFAGVMAVEWGGATRDRRDVKLGGWTSILAAGAVTTLAALTLGGSSVPPGTPWRTLRESPDRWAAGGMLLLFGLASLAPACYASALFTSRFRAHWSCLAKWKGVGLSYLLFVAPGALGFAAGVTTLASVSGALFAPLAGVLTIELFRPSGRTIRPGWDAAGVAAWVAGATIGLAPILVPGLRGMQPAALYGWGVAAFVHAALARPWAERSR